MAAGFARSRILFLLGLLPLVAGIVKIGDRNRPQIRWRAKSHRSNIENIPISTRQQLWSLRGGAQNDGDEVPPVATKKSNRDSEKKSKKNKKKNQSTSKSKQATADKSESKEKIAQVLQEDSASKLGDAIRDRADQILASPASRDGETSDRPRRPNTLLDQIDQTVSSVGFALGASDRFATLLEEEVEDETGGVETATTAVLVHYFLKSHGGAHAVQCLCSLLACMTGSSAMILPFAPVQKQTTEGATTAVVSNLCLILIKRCMIFAMMKHLSGLLAATTVAAKAIPHVGLRNARGRIHELVRNPVSQYVFYSASVLFWLGAGSGSTMHSWWQKLKTVPLVLVGPVLLREWISTMLVLSDVLVLFVCTNRQNSEKEVQQKGAILVIEKLLKICQAVIDILMSLLVTPKVWRPANAAKRQEIMAKLTSRTSLAMELLVGLIMSVDFMYLFANKVFLGSGSATGDASTRVTPVVSFGQLVKTGICAQLYLQFLWVRRKKIAKMATKVRGGAAQVPLYVMDVLLNPAAAMGFDDDSKKTNSKHTKRGGSKSSNLTWRDAVITGLGLD